MKACEWIDRLKDQNGWDSDYRVAQELGVSRATVSLYRSKKSTFDEETSLRVAASLGVEPAMLLIDQALERTRNEKAKSSMTDFLRRHGFNWPLDFNTGLPLTVAEIEFRKKYPDQRWNSAMRMANRELGTEAPLEQVLEESKRYRNGRMLNKVASTTTAIFVSLALGLFGQPQPAQAGIGGNEGLSRLRFENR